MFYAINICMVGHLNNWRDDIVNITYYPTLKKLSYAGKQIVTIIRIYEASADIR